MNGALLIHKVPEVTSFGVLQSLQKDWCLRNGGKKNDAPKLGHGGTLDPFATGLLIVLVGRGVKLARYFLGSIKTYEGRIRFGETTIPGDPTDPISETSLVIPESISDLRNLAHQLTQEPYFQKPPMHSAKKLNGKPLYELARKGIEVEREAKKCTLFQYDILNYTAPLAEFKVVCSAGTYIRTLTQDFAKALGTVGLLETLHRTASGNLKIENALTLEQILEASQQGKKWDQLKCWIPFDQLLSSYPSIEVTAEERLFLCQGKQFVLGQIIQRAPTANVSIGHSTEIKNNYLAFYHHQSLVAIARKENDVWGLERVFTE